MMAMGENTSSPHAVRQLSGSFAGGDARRSVEGAGNSGGSRKMCPTTRCSNRASALAWPESLYLCIGCREVGLGLFFRESRLPSAQKPQLAASLQDWFKLGVAEQRTPMFGNGANDFKAKTAPLKVRDSRLLMFLVRHCLTEICSALGRKNSRRQQ